MPADEPTLVEQSGEPEEPAEHEEPSADRVEAPPRDESPVSERPRLLASLRTTVVLVVALVLLLGVAAVEGWYLWLQDDPVVSAARPVVTGEIAHRAAVEAAAASSEEIFSNSFRDYDDQVEQATETMTDGFEQDYRVTAADVKPDFVDAKTEVEVRVVAQGVRQASSEQVQALLFFSQVIKRGGEDTTITPYRALVTVVHTESGWLVDAIDTL